MIAITLLCKIKNCITCFFSSRLWRPPWRSLAAFSHFFTTSSASASFTEDRLAASNNKEYSWSMNITICILNAYYIFYRLYSKFSNKSMIYTLFIGVLNVIEATPITSYATTSRLNPPPSPHNLSGGGGGRGELLLPTPIPQVIYRYTRVAICAILLYNCLHVNLDIFIWLY